MRMPRSGPTLRRMMVVVAIVALCLAGLVRLASILDFYPRPRRVLGHAGYHRSQVAFYAARAESIRKEARIPAEFAREYRDENLRLAEWHARILRGIMRTGEIGKPCPVCSFPNARDAQLLEDLDARRHLLLGEEIPP